MSQKVKIYASLHAHSTHSDGVYSPEELAKIGLDEGYGALVLTARPRQTKNDKYCLQTR